MRYEFIITEEKISFEIIFPRFSSKVGVVVHHVHACRVRRGGRSKQTSVVQHRLPLYAGTGLYVDDAYSLGTHALVEQDISRIRGKWIGQHGSSASLFFSYFRCRCTPWERNWRFRYKRRRRREILKFCLDNSDFNSFRFYPQFKYYPRTIEAIRIKFQREKL